MNTLNEIYKQIPNFEDYQVSNYGNIRSCKKNKSVWVNLKLRKNNLGRMYVILSKEKTKKNIQVAHLVLQTFVGPRPDGMECCHNNSKQDDNRLENLRWDTRSNNRIDSIKAGNHNKMRLNENDVRHIIHRHNLGENPVDIAKSYNLHRNNIYNILNRKTWKHIEEE